MAAESPEAPGGRRLAVMEDVAAMAGVSAMTVSRVLNTPERVRPQTRARVMAAVQALDYRPNSAARVLATGRSGVLGVVSFDTTLYGPASTLFSIEQAAREHGYTVSIVSLSALNRRSIGEGVERLRAQSADGIMVVAPHESAADGLRELPSDTPLVAVGAGGDVAFPTVAVDHRAGAERAVRHLLSLGHETVVHLAGPSHWVDARGRTEGWRAALEAAGRDVPAAPAGDWSARSGYELGRQIAADPQVTAVFSANDAMALGLLRALREAGRDVPGDVSVVGFDDVPEAAYFPPPLTTVRQNFAELGRRAFGLLLGRIGGASPPVRPEARTRRVVEPELVVRESTGVRRRS